MDDFERGGRIDLSHTPIGRALDTGEAGETSTPIYASSPLLKRLRRIRLFLWEANLLITVVILGAIAVVVVLSKLHLL